MGNGVKIDLGVKSSYRNTSYATTDATESADEERTHEGDFWRIIRIIRIDKIFNSIF